MAPEAPRPQHPRTVVLTGASDGIGAAAARKLAARGDRLLLVGRSKSKLDAVANPLGAEAFAADFARLDDVRALAAWVLERTDRIDVLANNAGGIFGERVVTVDGNERTMQVNHYAPFLLTHLLDDVLRASGATIVNTSSVGSRFLARFDMDDLDLTRRYSAGRAYGNSKLANILFSKGLTTRHRGNGVNAVAFHPGNIHSNFSRETGTRAMKAIYASPIGRLLSTPETGADNLIWAADGIPGATWEPGEYYEPRKKPRRPNPKQNDAALVEAFWAESARRTGVPA